MGKKGIVIEQVDNEITVLFDNGSYKKIKTNRPLYIGEIYESEIRYSSRIIATAAIFILCLMAGIDFFTVTAQAELSSGINLGINRWNKVVTVEANNKEAQNIITDLAIKGSDYNKVIPKIIEKSIVADKDGLNQELRVEVKAKNKTIETDLQIQFDKSLQNAKGNKFNNNSNSNSSINNKGQSNNNNNNNKSAPASNKGPDKIIEKNQFNEKKLKEEKNNSEKPNQSFKNNGNKPFKEKPKTHNNNRSSNNNSNKQTPQKDKKDKSNANR